MLGNATFSLIARFDGIERKRLGDLTKPARKLRLGTSRLAISIGAARATGAFDLGRGCTSPLGLEPTAKQTNNLSVRASE
jgi:hypothetical protein